jgi:uncharacterized LabA/DUF88 family protein
MKKLQNNYAFIDAQNVYLAVKGQGWKVNWKKFRIHLNEKYSIIKAFVFVGYMEGNTFLYTQLQEAGFILVFKPVLKYKDGSIKGNVDAELVLHTMIQLPHFDQAVIITGDGDFYCLVQHLLEQNKLKVVLIPNQHKYSALLKKFAKQHIAFMNDLRKKIGT